MNYVGFYINLDRSTERRKAIEERLAQVGLAGRYTRFPAVEGNAFQFPNPGLSEAEMGCFSSHYRVLIQNRDQKKPLHIIEDDILISPLMEPVIDKFVASDEMDKYDIVFTELALPLSDLNFMRFKKTYDKFMKRDKNGAIEKVGFTTIDMKGMLFAATSSFVVNPKSIRRILESFEAQLFGGGTSPVDLFICACAQEGRLRVGCLFPFVTSIVPTNFGSTIHSRPEAKTLYAGELLRQSFYVGGDPKQCYSEALNLSQPSPEDVHNQLLLRLLGFYLSPDYGKV